MPLNRLVPSIADWRAGEHGGEKRRNVNSESEKPECVKGISEPRSDGGEDSFVEK